MLNYTQKKAEIRGKIDTLFSDTIKARAGYKCEITGDKNCQCAHLMAKGSYPSLKWDLDNAMSLKSGLHKFYTHHPVEWRKFLIEHFGEKKILELESRAMEIRHGRWNLTQLEAKYVELKVYRDSLPR
jgi:hypothetical protein